MTVQPAEPTRTDLRDGEVECEWGHAHLATCHDVEVNGCHTDWCPEDGCDAGLACCTHCTEGAP